MSDVLDLLRPDLRGFAGYSSARRSAKMPASVWLNANENPWPNPADPDAHCRRYPEPQPEALRATLAQLYGVSSEQLLIGRGSDEAIDLLVRALCRPGVDAVINTPPVFGMYAVCARLQNAPLIEVPLREGDSGFDTDMAVITKAALHNNARLVFVCAPANPTGQGIAPDEISALARALRGQALVVVDEAYGEFSAQASATTLMAEHRNIAVLRTLSKAHALAAARIGCLIADPELISVLRNCQAPYPLPTPCVELALAALMPEALAITRQRVTLVISERERLLAALPECPGVRRVYPSQGNYLLLRFADAEAVFARLLAVGIMVRDMRALPQLGDALRISIGSPEQNDLLLMALGAASPATGASA